MSDRWDSISADPDQFDRLPVDLTPGGYGDRPVCWRMDRPGIWRSWGCTRPFGHTGRHAAGDGIRIRAVWP